ncbi:Sensor histidine kinase RcsC (plasmid) [Caballeronia sp. SBC1]|uniref:ATP-binding protein n=1 Tax=unclassified Caballeronia TaxID=2646786 RepID=UPI0013E1A6E2|nr:MULTISPECIES: ATP-binding protein [unclassified Caballeronia]QIE27870.1 Sensor histidine kinase RcsC [Caballeronia sp. SBC2]QIN65935.1 Sensor histidine kinase RcsC [Caballeronia sp. SBC1]
MVLNTFSALWTPLSRFRHSVVMRLIATVLLFSCVVTLLLTALQLYGDYHRGIALIENRLSDIDQSYRDSLSEGLWRLDRQQLQLELDGMLRLADIRAAEVRETGSVASPLVVRAGQRMNDAVISRQFLISYRVHGTQRVLGTLYVEATLSGLYRELAQTALVILVSQAANTFLVALFIIYIFWRLVTRHLATIARLVDRYDFRESPQPFSLQRRQPRRPDELDRVVAAFHAMGVRLHVAYLDERNAAKQREALRSAEAANRAKGEFLANMSHELRTPLNGILGYAQILQRDSGLSERQRAGVAVIQRSGEHLLTLIDDTLDFARIEAGKLRLEIVDVALLSLVDAIREIIGVKAEEKQLDYVCAIAPDVPGGVRADARRLRQVLLNLLANAVKFTDSGRVSLLVTQTAYQAIRFEVRDTGIGIPPDQLRTVFEPFEQVGNPERRSEGTGLGLAISREFLLAMGGEIHVESVLGQGSTFWFELAPATTGGSGTSREPDARVATGYEGPRRKVLVIDDIAVNRTVITDLLSRLGFEIVEAASGDEGLVKAQSERPALIVTDIVMPGMDGLEATRRLRQTPGLTDVPIIVVTASPTGADEKKSLAAGVNAFLPKPVDFGRLLTHIRALLNLEWTYAARAHSPQSSLPDVPVAIPAPQMDELHHLARIGNMRDIIAWADRVSLIDPQYEPFTTHLRALAKGYQSKAILLLVEHYLEARPAP